MVDATLIQELLQGRHTAVLQGRPVPADTARRAIFPGAFNPLHDGHRRMAALAEQLLEVPVEFEISVHNVDKTPLSCSDVHARLAQFHPDQPVWLTRAETFVEKAGLFPRATFVVGVDTIQRVADVDYYDGRMAERDRAIDRLRYLGCRFLVFGRQQTGGFCQLPDCRLPAGLSGICQGVPETAFRLDISSRQLRKQAGQQ